MLSYCRKNLIDTVSDYCLYFSGGRFRVKVVDVFKMPNQYIISFFESHVMFTDRRCPLPYITWLILDAPTQFDGRDVPSIGLSNKHVQQRKAKSESEQRPTLYVPIDDAAQP